MKPDFRILRYWILSVLPGAAVPYMSGLLLLFYQEMLSAIVISTLNLGKYESGILLKMSGAPECGLFPLQMQFLLLDLPGCISGTEGSK